MFPPDCSLDIDFRKAGLNKSPLHIACASNEFEIAKSLLEHGARVDEAAEIYGATPCMLAASAASDSSSLLKLLIEDYNANSNIIDTNGLNAINYAEKSGNINAQVYLQGLQNLEQDQA